MKPIDQMPLEYAMLRFPLEWAKFVFLMCVDQPPRETCKKLEQLFDHFGFKKPKDWAAFATNGENTDSEMADWEDMIPEGGFALQPRKSQTLLVGATGPIYHPTKMVPWGNPIFHPGRAA
jgi:hypothetical protein